MRTILVKWGVFVVLGLAHPLTAQPQPMERPAVFEVRLPAKATLEIGGYKTTSTGEIRFFESPPLPVGRSYTYTLRAEFEGRVVTRTVDVSPDRVTVIDLRPDFKPAPPAASFVFHLPASFSIKAGTSASLDVQVKRTDLDGAIEVSAADLPKGVKVGTMTIAAKSDRVGLAISVDKDAKPGDYLLIIHGKSGEVTATAKLRLTIDAPDKPPVVTFHLQPVAALTLKPGETGSVTVNVKRENYDGDIRLGFSNLPNGLSIAAATITGGKEQATAKVVAAKTLAPGKYTVAIEATASLDPKEKTGFQKTATFEVIVLESVKPKPPVSDPPRIGLNLTTPAAVSVKPGASAKVTVKIDRASIQGPVRVTIEGLPHGVRAEPVVAAAGQEAVTLILQADTDAVDLERDVVIRASTAGGAVRTETDLKLKVGK